MTEPRKVCASCHGIVWDRSAVVCPSCLADLPVTPAIFRDLVRLTQESNARIRAQQGPVGILGVFGVRTRVL